MNSDSGFAHLFDSSPAWRIFPGTLTFSRCALSCCQSFPKAERQILAFPTSLAAPQMSPFLAFLCRSREGQLGWEWLGWGLESKLGSNNSFWPNVSRALDPGSRCCLFTPPARSQNAGDCGAADAAPAHSGNGKGQAERLYSSFSFS